MDIVSFRFSDAIVIKTARAPQFVDPPPNGLNHNAISCVNGMDFGLSLPNFFQNFVLLAVIRAFSLSTLP